MADGSLLPRLDQLSHEFDVSKPSIREALRILETEGLVTVKRGKAGGAVVHTPSARGAAYTLGFVLQSQDVSLSDLANALKWLEPTCAALCAAEGNPELIAKLAETVEQTRAASAASDEVGAIAISRRFHELIVEWCGNRTLIVVIGALEALWSAHQLDWAARLGARYDTVRRESGVLEHERLITAIESGDPTKAYAEMARHLEQGYAVPERVSEELKVQRPTDPRLAG
jgi:DNA-binding FadR family transcriptional regulator